MSRLTRLLDKVVGRVIRRTRIDERRRLYPVGRDEFRYCEDDRFLDVQIELLSGKPRRLLYPSTITSWLPPHENEPISESKRREIARTICEFLNATGETTEIFRSAPEKTGQ